MIDANYNVVGYPPQYLAAQVISKEWVQPVDAPHKQFKASSDVNDAAGNVMVTAYAVERPDGQWSVMLVNRDQSNDHAVKISFANSAGKHERHFSGQVDRITFGSNEYQWHQEGASGHAGPGRSAGEVNGAGKCGRAVPAAQGVHHGIAWADLRMIQASSSESELHVEILTKEEVFVLRMVILQGRSLGRA